MKTKPGLYYAFGILLIVKEVEGQLLATLPGVPDGYEVILQLTSPEQYRAVGGPFAGSPVQFVHNEAGEITAIRFAHFTLNKITVEALSTLFTTEYHLAPAWERTAEKEAQFAQLLQFILTEAQGDWVPYNLPYPKHEFIQYVTAQDVIIFHGSNSLEINEFQPIRKSVELRDETGRGNVQAVYGTHDGLWAMFFAIVDRARLVGSIHNGVQYFHNRAGEPLALYNFSINQAQLAERPYTAGALYFLPRTTFVRLSLTAEVAANEWASEQPVRPHARLLLQPEDFPFLERIGGHDDTALIRVGEIAAIIRQAAAAASLAGDQFTIDLPPNPELTDLLQEYITLQKELMPAARFAIITGDDKISLRITQLPPALRQVLSDRYSDLLT